MVKYVISKNVIDINTKGKYVYKPLNFSYGIFFYIIFNRTILFSACDSKNLDLIKYILSFEGIEKKVDENDETALFYALKYTDLELVKFLISTNKFDIKARNIYHILKIFFLLIKHYYT